MASDPPGWYRDPKRPGMARYWDGHAWVDVDQVVDGHADAAPHDLSSLPSGPRIVSQRRSSEDSKPPTAGPVDDIAPGQLDVSPSPSEPESRQD